MEVDPDPRWMQEHIDTGSGSSNGIDDDEDMQVASKKPYVLTTKEIAFVIHDV